MAYIEVNYGEIRTVAAKMESYCEMYHNQVNQLKSDVNSVLKSDWIGEDSVDFSLKWDDFCASGSTEAKNVKAIEDYAAALRQSANKYQSAQENAVNRASLLWF